MLPIGMLLRAGEEREVGAGGGGERDADAAGIEERLVAAEVCRPSPLLSLKPTVNWPLSLVVAGFPSPSSVTVPFFTETFSAPMPALKVSPVPRIEALETRPVVS